GGGLGREGLAARASFRMYSKPLPWSGLLPVLVTTLIEAPELRPYSAEKFDVAIFTCSMKSIPTLLIWLLFDPESMLNPPSTASMLELVRLPLTDVLMPRPTLMSSALVSSTGEPGISVASCM